jgi:hypothetical protein
MAATDRPHAGRVRITFEALAGALNLPDGTHIVAVQEVSGRSEGEWPPRHVDIALVGPALPALSEGQSWPLVDLPFKDSE